jgi:hypothetical protein
MQLTWVQIVNLIFKAHSAGDVVEKYKLMSMLDEVEPDFAETMDLVEYDTRIYWTP